jgi:hypothetical protein
MSCSPPRRFSRLSIRRWQATLAAESRPVDRLRGSGDPRFNGVGPLGLEVGPEFDPSRLVHREDIVSRPTGRGQALDEGPYPPEMLGPDVPTRVEERDNLAGVRLDARQVRALDVPLSVADECSCRGIDYGLCPFRRNLLAFDWRSEMKVMVLT